jgi:hypothetical protein
MPSATSPFTWTTPFDAEQIDFSRPFIPEEFCPFTYLDGAAALPAAVLLRQNQLHALCGLELIQFFEWCGRLALKPLANEFSGTPLGRHLEDFIADETMHSRQFAALARAVAPQLYATGPHHFIRVSPWVRAVTRVLCAQPRWLPFWPWLMLVQEEKSLYISRAYLRDGAEIESNFVAVYRLHATDEAHHVGWDEELIAEMWPRVPAWWRRVNARFLTALLMEFFLAPKRAGARLIDRLATEFPEHAAALNALRPGLARLGRDPRWQKAAYPGAMLPRTIAQMERWPEFSRWRKFLVEQSSPQATP